MRICCCFIVILDAKVLLSVVSELIAGGFVLFLSNRIGLLTQIDVVCLVCLPVDVVGVTLVGCGVDVLVILDIMVG